MKKLMKNLAKNLSLVAFVLAIGAAFAFKPAEELDTLTLYGQTSAGQWEVASGTYTCDQGSQTCVAKFDNNDPDTGNMVYEEIGEYVP